MHLLFTEVEVFTQLNPLSLCQAHNTIMHQSPEWNIDPRTDRLIHSIVDAVLRERAQQSEEGMTNDQQYGAEDNEVSVQQQ
ncbi:hypothetical protein MIR68_006303 [Amoeboaphelidium protococcarum]|nr:hypothetical protein MIR68_006303 [Amoeboaphelidium protococcarum]